MRGWLFLLQGPIVWTVHFFALFGIASIFLTTPLARVLTVLVTLLCLGASAILLVRTVRSDMPTATEAWMRTVAICGLGLTVVAVVWQGLPAIFA